MDWIDEWASERRDDPAGVDLARLLPILRLARLGVLIDAFQHEVLAAFELTPRELDVLGALRGAGRPYALNPSQLYGPLRLSSGGTTKILKRLEETGLVARTPDPEDGRSVRIALTERGIALHDRVLRALAAASTRTLEGLSPAETSAIDEALSHLLEKLDVEASAP